MSARDVEIGMELVEVAPKEASDMWGEMGQDEAPGRQPSFRPPPDGENLEGDHRTHSSQYIAIGIWFVILFVGYWSTRAQCRIAGVPRDCRGKFADWIAVMRNLEYLFFHGFVLAVYTGMNWQTHFWYIMDFTSERADRKWYLFMPLGYFFFLFYLGTCLGWGWLDLIPGISSFSLTGLSAAWWAPLSAMFIGFVALVVMHIIFAWQSNKGCTAGFIAYIASRVALAGFYFLYIAIKAFDRSAYLHFHHYAVGYLMASLAEFNEPMSLILQAIGTGLFVQGLAAYGADSIITSAETKLSAFNINGTLVQSPPVSTEAATWVLDYWRYKYLPTG